jgi:hypothetical protein
MATPASLTPEEVEKLLATFRVLEELSEHELPVVSSIAAKPRTNWQALFELDLCTRDSGGAE